MSRFVVFLLSLFLLTSCASLSPDSGDSIIPDDTIHKKNIKLSESTLESHKLNIALLAPLGKQKEHIGAALIKSAQLAIADSNNQNVNLIILDSELLDSSPSALLKQINEQKIKIIIGPLYGTETMKLASLIKDKNITILSLSNDSSIKSDSLLIMGISPDSQATIATNYAISKGVEHFHLLLPNDKFGHLIDAAVENIVVDKNNVTHTVNWYNSENAGQVIDQLVASVENNPAQAIFMPQGGDNLNLLNASIAKHKRNNLTLIGLQSWDNPKVFELSSLNGAIFLRKNLAEEEFNDNFSKTFNSAATNIDFITYNSIMMAINMHRDQLSLDKQSIIDNNQVYGKYSEVIFTPSGLSLYKVSVAKIQGREFKLMESNP